MRELLKPEKYIIPMNSQWKTVFDTSILFVIGYSCFSTVLYIAFDIEESPLIATINWVVLGFFAFDFFFNFF